MAMRDAVLRSGQGERWFRWRGKDVSRVENLSDIVFALAVTLIVAQDVPDTFVELAGLWRDVLASGLCFALLLLIWRSHYIFFRRYDLEDGLTVALNSALLLLVISFAFPLKFLADFLVLLYTGGFESSADIRAVLSLDQAPILTVVYALGYAAVFGVFGLMYRHAGALADALDLTDAERALTRVEVSRNIGHVAVALVVIATALFAPQPFNVVSGALFMSLGVVQALIGRRTLKRLKRADADQAGAVAASDGR